MSATSAHVFISHGSDDRDEANVLSAFIEARGIRTWIAPRDVRPGQDYSEQLQHAIEQCAAFVVLVTEKANSSPYVRAETEMAFSTNKPIFPVRRSDIQPAAGLAFFLKIRHWTDGFGKHGDAAMERLGLELDALCRPPPREPVASAPTPAPASAPAPSSPPPPSPPAPALRLEPPAPPPLPAAREERLKAAIGPNADWYLGKWRKMEAGPSWLSWNWPAFLASFFWFAYRRMWLPLAIAVVIFLLTSFIAGRDPAFVAPAWLFLLALAALSGIIGNVLYRRQVTRLVAKADGLEQPVALAQIGAQGGISVPGLATSLAVFLLLFVAAAAAQINRPPPPAPGPPNGLVPPEPAPEPAASTVDATYLVGRWRGDNDADCGSSFNSDGSWTEREGGSGSWSLSGDRLTLTAGSTVVLQVVPVDANTMTLVQPDGALVHANRC
jgi:hypothetical protein